MRSEVKATKDKQAVVPQSPTTDERLQLALRLRQFSELGKVKEVNDFFQTLWGWHCHPKGNEDVLETSFVCKDKNSLNNYEFDLERIPDEVFWQAAMQTRHMPEEQLDILKRRYQLLEGERKLGSEKGTREMHANKGMIKKLTDENTRMRAEVAEAVHSHSSEDSVEKLIMLKNKYNEVKAGNERKIRKLKDFEARIEMEERQVHVPATDGGDVESRQIRVLENRIDKAMIKFNDALAINNTYATIHKRLADARIGADNVLKSLEVQIAQKKRESEELVSHCHESHHAKELAQAELHRFEQCVLEERNQMDAVVAEKKNIVQQRIEMNQKLEEKERKLKNFATPAGLKKETRKETHGGDPSVVSELSKLAEYEIAFAKLCEISGVANGNVNVIIEKFLKQETVHLSLVAETETQAKLLETAKHDLAKYQAQLEELRFSGNAPPKRTNQIDLSGKLEKAKSRFEKLAKHMIQINGGVGHLYTKLAPIDNSTASDILLSNETVEEVLAVCEAKIACLLAMPPGSVREEGGEIRVRIGKHFETHDFEDNEGVVFDRENIKASSAAFLDKRMTNKK